MATGWDLLRERRWDAARKAFEDALARRETAEDLEGLSWAAWWLDEAETVFEAREKAYRAYRDRGDAVGAGRMATWLATDQLDFHGAMAVVSGWLGRAHRLLDAVEPHPEHGWLDFVEGFIAHFQGDTERAGRLGERAAALGRRLGVPDLEMLGMALGGATLVACARVPEGMRQLDEATAIALAGEATVPIAEAWTFCFLVSACTAVADYERAYEWCDRIAEFADRYGSRYMLAFCRGDYGTINLWRGRWSHADALLRASVEDFAQSRPALSGASLAGLAELRRRQGRLDEAVSLNEQAGGFPRAQLGSARIALDREAPLEAAELAERLLRQVPDRRRLDRAPALEVLIRARLALGDAQAAAAACAELRDVALAVGTEPLEAAAHLADGMLAAARADHHGARILLEDAVDAYARSGAPFETALARTELARCLLAAGRGELAAREARDALRCLDDLGAGPAAERARAVAAEAAVDVGEELDGVTPRERQVLALLADGLTNREIAERLVVSEHTVHRHVANILRKLDAPTRAAAAAVAVRAGVAASPTS